MYNRSIQTRPEHTENRPAPCAECGTETEPRDSDGKPLFNLWDVYLVEDEVWREAGMSGYHGSGFLCTRCLEKRLGRDLVYDDFLVMYSNPTDDTIDGDYRGDYLERLVQYGDAGRAMTSFPGS